MRHLLMNISIIEECIRRFLLIVSLAFCTVLVHAVHVSRQSAEKIGHELFSHLSGMKQISYDTYDYNLGNDKENAQFYIMNFQPHGFAIIASDERSIPVLGYSLSSNFMVKEIPDYIAWLLEHYARQINEIRKHTDWEVNTSWHKLKNGDYSDFLFDSDRDVSALLDSQWGQNYPYNNSCPSDPNGPEGHATAGCVAIAMGQIMKFWNHPPTGTGSTSYNHPNYGVLSANFGETTYNWLNIPDATSYANSDLSSLVYHCGVSVGMNYGPIESSASSGVVRDAMINYFRFSEDAQYIHRGFQHTDASWKTAIRSQLISRRPVFYTADDNTYGGHAFVLDGYQGTDQFHFNWGWGGLYNGFYTLSDLSPFYYEFDELSQSALVNIYPVPYPPPAPSNLQAVPQSSTQINLTWQDNSLNENGFQLFRKIGIDGTWWHLANIDFNETSYHNTGLSPNTTYYYKIRAWNWNFESTFSNVVSVSTLSSQISIFPTFLNFGDVNVETNSSPQSYTLDCQNLSDNLCITAPTGFKIATSRNGSYSNTLTIMPSNGEIYISIWVRFRPLDVYAYSGNIIHQSGSASAMVSVMGSGVIVPAISVNPSSLAFGYVSANTYSPPQCYSVEGINLLTYLTVIAPSGFAVANSQNGEYGSSLVLVPSNGEISVLVWIRFQPNMAQMYSANVTNRSGSATAYLAVTGNATSSDPTVTIGSGNQQANIPIDMSSMNSLFQCLYYSTELGFSAGSISSVKFYNNFVENHLNKPLKIWMGNTTASTLSAFTPSTQLTPVFDGFVDLPIGSNTITITFPIPFEYNGGNIVMLVYRPLDSQGYFSTNYFRVQTSSTTRARKYSNTTAIDPAYPPYGQISSQFPKTTFVYSPSRFTLIPTALPGVSDGSISWGDCNDDGNLDLLYSGSNISRVYCNTGNGSFTDSDAGLVDLQYSSVDWGDYDNDGDLDILLSGYNGNQITRIYRNDGVNGFTDIDAGLIGIALGSVAWGDYDNDGDLDILLANDFSKIYRNEGNGHFNVINLNFQRLDFSSANWGDYDNDGDLDVLLTGNYQANLYSIIYRNDGDNVFTDINAGLTGVQGRDKSSSWGDYDNDGDLDILLSGSGITKVYRNNGNGTFSDVNAALAGVSSGSCSWGDYDNDGDLDILLTGNNGGIFISRVYRNNGNNTFTDVLAGLIGLHWSSSSWVDYDNDGDLDIMLSGTTNSWETISLIYRNDGNTSNSVPNAPTNLIASISGSNVLFQWSASNDVQTPSSGLSYVLKIGTSPDGIEISTPMSDSSGNRKIPAQGYAKSNCSWRIKASALPAVFYWRVQAVDCSYAGSIFSTIGMPPPVPRITTNPTTCSFRNTFINTTSSPQSFTLSGINLSSNAIVTAPTGFAVSLEPDDNYCNTISLNQSGGYLSTVIWIRFEPTALQFYSGNVTIISGTTNTNIAVNAYGVLPEFFSFTDINVVLPGSREGSTEWGDFDNDGDLDILITGNYIARIYRNDGNNSFTDINAGLPGVRYSSAAWGDYDNDGDLDIILTGRFGNLAIYSYIANIYRNDGNNIFTNINAELLGVDYGSVAWGDYDNDGDLDILLTGNDSAKIYRNEGNDVFIDTNAVLIGLRYSSVCWGDYDNDCDLDILMSGVTSNPYGRTSRVYRNDGDGIFTDINAGLQGVEQGSVDWGDFDNDGDLDILLTGYYYDGANQHVAKVYRNSGNDSFIDINANLLGVRLCSADWGNYNNDAFLDILLTGSNSGTRVSKVYVGDQNGEFTDTHAEIEPVHVGMASWGDYDNDGDIDIILAGQSITFIEICRMYRNNCSVVNTPPSVPTSLSTSISGTDIVFQWNPSIDSQMPSSGLRYILKIGTTPNGCQISSPMGEDDGIRLLPKQGYASSSCTWKIKASALPEDFFWSVQAIDNAFLGSAFSVVKWHSIDTPEVPTGVQIAMIGNNVQLNWEAVTETVSGIEIIPDLYLIYAGYTPSIEDNSYILIGQTQNLTFTHEGAALQSHIMYYYVRAYINTGERNLQPNLFQKMLGITNKEVDEFISNVNHYDSFPFKE